MNKPAFKLRRQHLPLLATLIVFIILFAAASMMFQGFFSMRVITSLFGDNSFLGITAVGMTLVIFTGGIDLSVGSVVGFTAIFVATLIQQDHFPTPLAWITALLVGSAFGTAQGLLITVFDLPPFLITLAGLFFARGAAFWISTQSIGIQSPLYDVLANFALPITARASMSALGLTFVAVVIAGYLLAHHTRFGRNLLAMGGSEQSALLMGLPVNACKIAVYAINGFCASLAGIVATLYTSSGNPSMGIGMELDAITVVVIGGTLLTGGRGHIFGTLLGVLIYGTIQSAMIFDGRLNPWSVRIVVACLLLAFILLQRFFVRSASGRAAS